MDLSTALIHLFSVVQNRSYESPNSFFATQQPQVVDQKVAKELEAHRLAGPFDSPPFPVFRVSPLGINPKKTLGDFHMIHHLSFPRGESLMMEFPMSIRVFIMLMLTKLSN